MRVGENQKKIARKANLYEFLLKYHPETVKKCGKDRLQSVEHDSLIITKNMGFYHNSMKKSGNSVDYLCDYLHYDFTEAVAALAAFEGVYGPSDEKMYSAAPKASYEPPKAPFEAPARYEGNFSRTCAYLTETRKIDAKIVQNLIDKGLLYEEKRGIRHNAIFFSDRCNYAEIEGTLSDVKFKGSAKNPDEGGYWIYIPSCSDVDIEKIYICESAIDAISLYQLHLMDEKETAFSAFLSTGGAAKDAAYERAKKDFPSAEFITATDDDTAGNNFAMRHSDLKRIIPEQHDWNDTLIFRLDLPY